MEDWTNIDVSLLRSSGLRRQTILHQRMQPGCCDTFRLDNLLRRSWQIRHRKHGGLEIRDAFLPSDGHRAAVSMQPASGEFFT